MISTAFFRIQAAACGQRFLAAVARLISPRRTAALTIAAAAATANAQSNQDIGGSSDVRPGARIIDWTPSSDWRAQFAAHGRSLMGRSTPKAPPAYGRDQMRVRAKYLERIGPWEGKRLASSPGYYTGQAAERSRAVLSEGAGTVPMGIGEQSTDLIHEITWGLKYDPLAIYNWVLQNVAFEPYYGLWHGAHNTALELQGNDYDQCVLLVSLLKQAGIPPSDLTYIEYDVQYSAAEIDSWLKWDIAFANSALDGLGIPRSLSSPTGSVTFRRVMVQAVIDGRTYLLDPAFKRSERTSPLALSTVYPSYSASALTTTAGGSAPSDDEVSGVSVDAFQNALSIVESGYVRNAAQNYHSLDARQVLGIPVLSQTEVSALPTNIAQPHVLRDSWNAIPENRAAKLTVQLGSAETQYNWCDLADDVLNLRFGVSNRASLYRNNTLESTEAGPVGANFSVGMEIVFPQAPATSLHFSSGAMTRTGRTVLVPTFGAARGRLKRIQQQQVEEAEISATSEWAATLTLATIAWQRAVHDQNSMEVVGAMTDRLFFDRGSIWLLYDRSGQLTVDGVATHQGLHKIRNSSYTVAAAYEAWATWGSVTESLCLEQVAPTSAKSSVTVVEGAMRDNRKILRLRQGNWSAAMAQVEGGETGILPGVKTHVVTNNNRAFVPSKLQVPIYGGGGELGGAAILANYIAAPWDSWTSLTWLIDGGYNGGKTQNGGHATTTQAGNVQKAPDKPQQNTALDPVDILTGAFLYEAPGLKLGNESTPTSIDYRHFYSSSRRLENRAQLAPGWTHSYDIWLATRHASEVDIRAAALVEVAPLVVAAQYMLDTFSVDTTAKEMALRALTASWAARNYVNSKMTVALGEQRIEFQRLADNTYVSATSLPATFRKLGGGTFELSFRHSNTTVFNALDETATAGKASSIVDPYGNTMLLNYDASGRLLTVTDAYNRTLTFVYGGSGLSTVTDSTARSISYPRSPHFGITGPDGGTMRFPTSQGRIDRVEDELGRIVTANHYDLSHRVWAQDPLGEPTRENLLGYAPGQTMEMDTFTRSAWTKFDSHGRKVWHRNMVGSVTQWAYDGADRLTKMITPRGGERTYTYDSAHVLRSVTEQVVNIPAVFSRTRTTTTDAFDRPETVTDFAGRTTTYTYNDFPKTGSPGVTVRTMDPLTVTSTGGVIASFEYDGRGRIYTSHPAAFAAGHVMTYAYDSFGFIDKITYPGTAPNVDDYTFDAQGNLTEFIDRRSVKTTFGYNKRRLRTSVTLWQGTTQLTSEVNYDASGNVDYTLDASGRKVDYDYDALGNLLTIKQGPIGAQVTTLTNVYEDQRMLVVKVRDGLGSEVRYDYDAAHRLTDIYDPLNRRSRFGYDADGNRVIIRTPLQSVTTQDFDLVGRLAGVLDAVYQPGADGDDGNTARHTVSLAYDLADRVTQVTNRLPVPGASSANNAFATTYADASRTVTSKTPRQRAGGPDASRASTFSSNTRGLPNSAVEPSGQTTTFDTYDLEGRLLQKTDGAGVVTYTYWPNGLPKEVTENGHTTYRGYDSLNRLNEYRDGEGNTLRYDYYPSGELKEITYPDGKRVTYTYDSFRRLRTVTDWASPARVTTYDYDNANRLRRIDRPNHTYRVQEYDIAGQLRYIKEYKSSGALILFQEMRYDEDGRLTYLFLNPRPAPFIDPRDTLDYDEDNRLTTWNSQATTFDYDGNMTHGPLPSGAFGAYVYDARNRLTSADGSGYRYNPDGLRVETTGAGAANFVVDPSAALSRVLTRTKNGATTYYVYGLGLLYEENVGAAKFYHSNQVGSTLAITNESQTVTDEVRYSPFGRITERTPTTLGTQTDTPFLFNGEFGVMTDASGLQYMRARYYNPRVMRFVTADPIGFSGGVNWYRFASGNPVSRADPLGLKDSKDSEEKLPRADVQVGEPQAIDWWDSVAGAAVATDLPSAMDRVRLGPIAVVALATAVIHYGMNAPHSYVVYQKVNYATGKTYFGRTDGYGEFYTVMEARDAFHHMSLLGYGDASVVGYITTRGESQYAFNAIRGLEQQMIDFLGGKNSPRIGNRINAVSSINLNAEFYYTASVNAFGKHADFRGVNVPWWSQAAQDRLPPDRPIISKGFYLPK